MAGWGIAIAWLLAVAQAHGGVPAAAGAAGGAQSATAALRARVNEVALERLGPKEAIVEYTGAASGGEFRLLKSGAPIRSGRLTPLAPFSEWGAGKRYFRADFSALTAAGRYELEATLGQERVRSAAFEVGDQAVLVTTAAKLLDYFHASRWTSAADRHIRIYDTDRFVDVWGGWKDAGGDTGKYLSHLSFANFFNPQQSGMVVWALGKSYDTVPQLYARLGLTERVLEETFWGADYLHRVLDPQGYFYETVFDRWGEPGAERMVTGFEGLSGVYSAHYRAAYREGGGLAIAALARASIVSAHSGAHGEFTGPQYLADAERAFAHLETNNTKYCANGVENIIDDYTALLAATELYRATGRQQYLQAARRRAQHVSDRLSPQGWFVSDGGTRPY
ncbi:MAG TPA: glycoside hydrolase family 9 protein [Steroidobacteraceae bacterium]